MENYTFEETAVIVINVMVDCETLAEDLQWLARRPKGQHGRASGLRRMVLDAASQGRLSQACARDFQTQQTQHH